MKKIRDLILLAILAGCLGAAVGCSGNALSRPVNLKIDSDTLVLSWKPVANAVYYKVKINDTEQDNRTVACNFELEFLSEGTYDISVKAFGGEGKGDSAWSEPIRFVRESETGLVFTLINNNTEYEVKDIGSALRDITVPDTYRGKPVTSIGEKAFQNKRLTSVVLGKNITNIAAEAFSNCSYLESINIPDKVVNIGEKAFQSCRTLTSIVLPDGVTEIKANTFQSCINLESLTLGDHVTAIGENAFYNCRKLESFVIPDTVLAVGNNAFSACEMLKSVTIGRNVRSLGSEAFRSDSVLSEVIFKNDSALSEIGSYAFAECGSLTSIDLPAEVTSIGEYAFYNCAELSEIVIGNNIEQIGMRAFEGTAYLNNAADTLVYLNGWLIAVNDREITAVDIREDTVGISGAAFYRCNQIMQIILPDSVKVIEDYAFYGCESLMQVVIGSGVERIGRQAFYNCKKLATVILGSYDFDLHEMTGSSLKTIDSYAFMGCELLKDIEIPDTVESIGSYAFRNSGLYNNAVGGVVYAGNWLVDCNNNAVSVNVTVREGTVGIANYAFYNCSTLTTIRVADSVRTIGRGAFYGCSSVLFVILPSELEVIEDYTFYGCYFLGSIEIPKGVTKIGRSAFYGCKSLMFGEDGSTLTMPDTLKTIGDYAFFGCGYETSEGYVGLEEIVLGNGVTSIGYAAFYNFVSLKRVDLGSSLQTIGDRAFYQCVSLEEVTGGVNVRSIGERAFYRCSALKGFVLSDEVTEIGDYTFYRCTALSSVTFGKNVKTIGSYAFFACESLQSVSLPASLESIGKYAFRNCKALQSVVIGKGVTFIDMHAFYGCALLTLYVEQSSGEVNWHSRWNSSYRPVVWGCELSEDGGYVVSVTVGDETLGNNNTSNTFAAPCRDGYVFAGWATSSGSGEVAYSAEQIAEVPEGTTLYAVWEEPSAEPEEPADSAESTEEG